MILSIDIGNTQTCIGAFENNSNDLVELWRFSTREKITIDEVTLGFVKIVEQSNFTLEDINMICASCVVPSLAVFYSKAINAFIEKRNLNVSYIACNPKNAKKIDKSLYDCKYPFPNEVGGDIIASVIAARIMYKTPFVVVDFGTATNFNVVNKNEEFLGGMIAPGLKPSLQALVKDAKALSDIEIKASKNIVGKTTGESIQSGTVVGEAARADGLITRLEEDFGYKVNVICTGGWSKLLHSEMKYDVIWNPSLVLQGLKIFAENYNG